MNTSAPTKTFDVEKLVRRNILEMKPYSSARDEFKGEAEVFLDANENPFPSPYNRYPDPLQWKVKQKLAELKNCSPAQIFLGNGSDEPIDLLIRAFCYPEKEAIVITDPTYGMYSVCAEVNAVGIKRIPLTPTFDIDPATILRACTQEVKIIFLCSPNNPTANLLSVRAIETILNSFTGIVVVDEAYIDFASSPGFLGRLAEFPNLVVLQTFSKAWGLAALRCGMAFASPEIISTLNKIKYPYNINIRTQELVLEALHEEDRKNDAVKEILEQRKFLAGALANLPLVKTVFPSDANFLLVRVPDAPALYEYLMNNKIIVRDRSKVTLCENALRITVGTRTENERLLAAIKTFNAE